MIIGLIYLFYCIGSSVSVDYSCVDESNKPVDWFVMYKLPLEREERNKLVKEGMAYAYITSDSSKGWTLSKRALKDKDSIPGLTLGPLYEKSKKDVLYFMYNDQPPGKQTHSGGGHAKGVVVAGKDGGFWLVHSVPRFAPAPKGRTKYSFPESGTRNGQSFLCITLKPEDLNTVGAQLKYNEVWVFAKSVPKKLADDYPDLADVADGKKEKALNKVRNIKSADGKEFRVFSKSSKYHKELYTDFVAPDLKVDLVVQTWPNSRSHQKSSCSRKNYRVENIDETSVAGVDFTSTKDHSKWAASSEKSKPWVCVGDINKDDSQEKRGGGTVCTKDKRLWQAYQDSIVEIQSCDGKNERKSDKIGQSPVDIYAPFWNPEYWKDMAYETNNQGQSRFVDILGPIG